MDHLWGSCTGLHSLDVLALHESMCTIHKYTEGILEYINALEDTDKCANLLVSVTTDHIIKEIFTDREWGPDHLITLANNNL